MSNGHREIPAADREEIVRVVAADLVATLGWSPRDAEEFVREFGGGWSAFVPQVILVAEDVQQHMHDDRIDTSWPRCPDHPHHPLRLSETLPAMWSCPSTGRTVCALGSLASAAQQD